MTRTRSLHPGSLLPTITEIRPEQKAIWRLAAFSGFVPTNARVTGKTPSMPGWPGSAVRGRCSFHHGKLAPGCRRYMYFRNLTAFRTSATLSPWANFARANTVVFRLWLYTSGLHHLADFRRLYGHSCSLPSPTGRLFTRKTPTQLLTAHDFTYNPCGYSGLR